MTEHGQTRWNQIARNYDRSMVLLGRPIRCFRTAGRAYWRMAVEPAGCGQREALQSVLGRGNGLSPLCPLAQSQRRRPIKAGFLSRQSLVAAPATSDR